MSHDRRGLRELLPAERQPRPALRRHLLRRRHLDAALLPAELPGADSEALRTFASTRRRPPRSRPASAPVSAAAPTRRPGSPDWNWRADRVARAMRLIADGTVDREGVPGLAKRLGFSDRHLRRLLSEQVGASPVALARAQRANTARLLIESTAMPFADAAFAAGFQSVRQFNDTIRDVFDSTPSEMRHRSKRASPRSPGVGRASPELPGALRRAALLRFLEARAVPGLEDVSGGTYRRALDPRPRHRDRRADPGTCVPFAACSASTIFATSPRRSHAAGACSTSTPTRWPSPRRSAATR